MKRPNIVFILSDDQGWWSLGCTGNSEIITPNIDRLAEEGMRFDHFFCASPVCSPARASLLTGCIPSQHGVHDWIRDNNEQQAQIEYLADQYSYTKALAASGYDCGLSGKWHMGASHKVQHGFSHWYCHKRGGGPYYNAPMYRDGVLYKEERYITDAITDDACEYLESRKDKEEPFFLYVGYTAPHSPWLNNHPKEYTDLYQNCEFKSVPHGLPRHPDTVYLTDEVAKDEKGNLIGYYAAITAMDAGIGRIMDQLQNLGMAEDTLVIFTADNGFSCGHHGFWGKGNGTFPINMYEESVKVPFIARHPGRIPAGTVCDSLVSAYDFFPTLLDYVDVKPEDDGNRPGVSFAPALEGKEFRAHDRVVILDEYGPNRMIRDKRFKFVTHYQFDADELYDLANDPDEECNLMKEEGRKALEERLKAAGAAKDCDWQALAADMKEELEQWFAKYVNPEIDGAKEEVFGTGQLGLAGAWGDGQCAHSHDGYIHANPNFQAYMARKNGTENENTTR